VGLGEVGELPAERSQGTADVQKPVEVPPPHRDPQVRQDALGPLDQVEQLRAEPGGARVGRLDRGEDVERTARVTLSLGERMQARKDELLAQVTV